MAASAVAKKWGGAAAQKLLQDCAAQDEAKAQTEVTRAQAAALSAAQVSRGEGAELDADRDELRAGAPRRSVSSSTSKSRSAKEAKSQHRDAKRAAKTERELGPLLRRRVRSNQREEEAAAQLAEKALQRHGIRHHYRPLPKLAWFVGYMAGVSLDRSIALRVLDQINMPDERKAQVIAAAYSPEGYTPRRDVCTGKRDAQHRYTFDGRTLSGKQWADGERDEGHPGAIRVLQCAAFLWLAKGRTSRRGYSYKVRGFGRGVFETMCRCSTDAITGHTRGMPGALRALAQSGFIEYGQPPSEKVGPLDRGPTGHAYLVFWFRRDAATFALDTMHARTARLARLPLLAKLLEEPALIEPMARPPPDVVNSADIPF